MDISQVGLQSNVGMLHSAEQRSVTGSFAGMSVQVKENAASALADSAEELTFVRDNSRQTKLADRKQKAAALNMREKVEKLLQMVQAAANSDDHAQNRVFDDWKKRGASPQDLLAGLKKLGGQPASNYGFLLQAASEESDPEVKEKLEKLAGELFESEKTAITASLNALSALENASFASSLDLSETYAEISANPQEPQDLLIFLQKRYGTENLKEGIDFMFRALAADLMSAQSSQEEPVLNDIASRLGKTRTLNASLGQFTDFKNRIASVLHFSEKLDPARLLIQTVELSKARFITSMQVNGLYRTEVTTRNPEDEVLVGQEFMKLARNLPLELFDSLDDRNRLLDAVHKEVDRLIAAEDEWLETQG